MDNLTSPVLIKHHNMLVRDRKEKIIADKDREIKRLTKLLAESQRYLIVLKDQLGNKVNV